MIARSYCDETLPNSRRQTLELTFSTKKRLLTQADTQSCVNTEKPMSRQDNLASQERVVVNERHCVDAEKSLCTQGNGCVNATLFDWCTHRFCALIHSFLV